MRTVRVNKGDLVNALTENRKKHKADYEKACEGYRDDMRTTLKDFVGKLSSGENVAVIIRDMPPEDHTKDYDVALKMLEMSVEQTIELSQEDFHHLVLDDWDWKRGWMMSNSKYFVQK